MSPSPVLCFSNPGTLDPRLITTFGATVKPESQGSPFGRFGTGLKYTIAGILRLGGAITLYTGGQTLSFELCEEEIRGKIFHTVYMTGQTLRHTGETLLPVPCGFTTALGSHWEPWMLYRELLCNALDENGRVDLRNSDCDYPALGNTAIVVDLPALLQVHSTRHTHFLLPGARPQPLWTGPDLEIYPGSSRYIFYRGIRVHELSKPSIFTYNLLGEVTLTEDRTLANTYSLGYTLTNAMVGALPEPLLRSILLAPKGSYEQSLDFDLSWHTPSEEFLSLTSRMVETKLHNLNESAVRVLRKAKPSSALPKPRPSTAAEAKLLAQACDLALKALTPISSPIRIVDSLGTGVMGMATEGQIWISELALNQGLEKLAGTLLEEQLHLIFGFVDATRAFQDFLIDRIIRLASGQELAPTNGLALIPSPGSPNHVLDTLADEIPF